MVVSSVVAMLSFDFPEFDPDRSASPLTLMWPRPGTAGPVYLSFQNLADWRRFIDEFSLDPLISQVMWDKYRRAQKLYYFGWIDFDCVKAGELAALVALELVLRDRYGGPGQAKRPRSGRPPMLSSLIAYMVEEDGLTDGQLPIFHKYGGGSIVRNLYETRDERKARGSALPPMNLVERRNHAAHGDPFDGMPVAGLIEVVRDLIEYAYRDLIRERRSAPGSAG
jgi:hypothetical protein